MATLLAIRGPLTGSRITLTEPLTRIGRSSMQEISLSDATVSRQHALIRKDRLGWILEDCNSASGTVCNGVRLTAPVNLAPNDEIRIGHSIFLFDSDFDLQNADFTDNAVFLSTPNDDTMELAPLAMLGGEDRPEEPRQGREFLAELGELFDSTRVTFADALRSTTQRIARLLGADITLLMLQDHLAGRLKAAAAIAPGDVLADGSVMRRVFAERKALMLSDTPQIVLHPAAEAPAPPRVRSVLAAPLLVDKSCLGVLYVERHQLDAYSLKDLRLLCSLGKLMAVFVEARQRLETVAMRQNYHGTERRLIGNSPKFRRSLEMVARIAPTQTTVLLIGETGTGKEVLAHEIHRLWANGDERRPFVAVNCAAIPESLFESQLFGHEKGAFTGAIRTHQGYIEQAAGGTLFLDEIGELSTMLQPKLLRFIQEHCFSRVGGNRLLRAEVRLIAATNRNLLEEVKQGRFREDLYHRLAVMPIEIPPLRERREDIRLFAEYYVERFAKSMGRAIHGISDEALIQMERYSWPGNVRELANCLERAVLLCDDSVLLPRHLTLGRGTPAEAPRGPGMITLTSGDAIPIARERTGNSLAGIKSLEQVEREHITAVLDACGGNQMRASDILGIHRNTLRKKLQDWGLSPGG